MSLKSKARRGGSDAHGVRLGCLATLAIVLHVAWTGTTPCSADPVFTDVTVAAGVDYIQWQNPVLPDDPFDPLAVPGQMQRLLTGGAAVGDYDRDGHVDLFVTRFDAPDILFRNLGNGTFQDATQSAGLDVFNLPSNGATFGDIDNDGDLDLYVTTVSGTRFYLFINDGSGTFTEEALPRGAAVDTGQIHEGFSIALGDYDRDGYLDLHVAEWFPDMVPSHNRLLRNLGSVNPGYFEDVTGAAGVNIDQVQGYTGSAVMGFASTFVDLDEDGWPDLALTGDFGTSRLFWNNQDGTFTDGTVAAGVGTDENGMGTTFGDYDGDGDIDWFVTAISEFAGNRLYRRDSGRTFSDQTDAAGVRNGFWGWGAVFLDADNDGDLDLTMTNGFINPPWLDDPMRYWRNDGGVFTELSGLVGLTDTRQGRGLLSFDYDEDGDLDLFVVNNAEHPVLYRNDGGNANDWLRVRVHGRRSNRDGLGAVVQVTATAGGATQVRKVGTESHFLGQSDRTAHFGFGPGPGGPVHEVRVTWPKSGRTKVRSNVARNSVLDITEPVGRCGLVGFELLVLVWVIGVAHRWVRHRRIHLPGSSTGFLATRMTM